MIFFLDLIAEFCHNSSKFDVLQLLLIFSTNLFHVNWSTLSAHEAVDEIATTESLQYDFNTIRVATDNFSEANKLGQGGFGAVYRVN